MVSNGSIRLAPIRMISVIEEIDKAPRSYYPLNIQPKRGR